MFTLDGILDALKVDRVAPDRYRASNVQSEHNVVFGGQLLAQSIAAGLAEHDGKTVKTLHTVFARSASPSTPVDITVERMHAGRALASSTVTISQGDRLCTRSIVLLSADEPDLIRHADRSRLSSTPEEALASGRDSGAWEARIVGGVDVDDPDTVGPPELNIWIRFVGAPEDPAINQALLAFASD